MHSSDNAISKFKNLKISKQITKQFTTPDSLYKIYKLLMRSPTHIKITRSAMKISMAAKLLNIVLIAMKKRRPCLK